MIAGLTANHLRRIAGTLALGAVGGWIAFQFKLPLAWMIGAMTFTTLAAIGGAPLHVDGRLRTVFVTVLGVMLGSGFTPELLAQMTGWIVSFLGLLLYVVLGGALAYLFLWRVCGYDRQTSYYAGMPGGFAEMVLAGEEAGADTRVITLVHAMRILIVVMTLPFALQYALDFDIGNRPPPGAPLADADALDLLILLGSAVAGYGLSRLLHIPGGRLVGPMVLSAAVHLAGWTEAKPPNELIYLAQVVVGSAIGARFTATPLSMIGRAAAISAGVTFILLAATLLIAAVMLPVTGYSLVALLLAYAPGGLAEMSLIAFALNADAPFVATHHIVRIVMVVILAPMIFRLILRPARAGKD